MWPVRHTPVSPKTDGCLCVTGPLSVQEMTCTGFIFHRPWSPNTNWSLLCFAYSFLCLENKGVYFISCTRLSVCKMASNSSIKKQKTIYIFITLFVSGTISTKPPPQSRRGAFPCRLTTPPSCPGPQEEGWATPLDLHNHV